MNRKQSVAQVNPGVNTDSSLIEQAVARMREQTGVGDGLKVVNTDWVSKMREGITASVTLRRWRGKTRLTLEDLGMDDERREALTKVMDLGHKLLMPRDMIRALDALDSRSRAILDRYGIKTHWGHFVPVNVYPDFKRDMEAAEVEYLGYRDQIVNTWGEWVPQIRAEYRQVANATYSSIERDNPALLKGVTRDQFVTNYVAQIVARIPSAAVIDASFGFELTLSYIPLPSMLAEEMARVEGIQAQVNLSREQVALQAETLRQRERAERDVIEAQRRAAMTSSQMREEMLREMNRDVVDRARKEAGALVDQFRADVVGRMASIAFEACYGVLDRLQSSGAEGLQSRTVVQLRNMVEQVDRLAQFSGDDELLGLMEQTRQRITGVTPDSRSMGEVQTLLGKIAVQTRSTLLALGERPASVRRLGLPDVEKIQAERDSRPNFGSRAAPNPTPSPEPEAVAVGTPNMGRRGFGGRK